MWGFDAGHFFGFAVAAGQHHVDAVIGQDESAGAGLGRDLGRGGAHSRRQNGRHVARALGLDDLVVAHRFARRHRDAHDRPRILLDGVGALVLADEGGVRSAGRPCLPLHVLGGQRHPDADVFLGDENLDGLDLHDRRRRRRRVRSAGQNGREAAGGDRDAQYDDTRGFHTLSLST